MTEPCLRVVSGPAHGREIALGPGELLLGRGLPEVIDLGDPEVSRRHSRIRRSDDGTFLLEDMQSTNGTYLNGWRIPTAQVLGANDRIQLGETILEVVLPTDTPTTSVRRRPVILPEAVRPDLPPPAPAKIPLRAAGVTKSYGDLVVLRGVDVEIEPGEICGLLGPNGAGKTTFVSIVAGLRKADGGSVYVNGVDALADAQAARQYLGIAPQDLGIYPTLTVRRNLELFGRVAGLSGAELDRRVNEVGEALSLTPKFGAKASTCSGGQQRRLHTGMALMNKPPLLILDEPTVGADIRTRQEILESVKRLAEEGHGICYSTHYLPEIEELGATVAILEGGKIIARGSIAELVAQHSQQALELHFDGPAPALEYRGEVVREGSVLRLTTSDPAGAAPEVVRMLGYQAMHLTRIEMIRPSLDSVYLALTHRRYSGVAPIPPEVQELSAAGATSRPAA